MGDAVGRPGEHLNPRSRDSSLWADQGITIRREVDNHGGETAKEYVVTREDGSASTSLESNGGA
eukprot:2563715-Pyramimonas_sp.AAC.1